jgi:hypothetical protein
MSEQAQNGVQFFIQYRDVFYNAIETDCLVEAEDY